MVVQFSGKMGDKCILKFVALKDNPNSHAPHILNQYTRDGMHFAEGLVCQARVQIMFVFLLPKISFQIQPHALNFCGN